MYKTGYAPIMSGEKVVGALAVSASAWYFRDLTQLRNYLLLSGALIAALVVLISVVIARRITLPLRELAGEAMRIGRGDLENPVDIQTRDEVGVLASTMNEMRKRLFERDQELQLMLSGIAHEVRNPLGGLALFSGLLRDDLRAEPERLKMVQRIEQELDALKHVVEEFLAYTRKQATTFTLIDLDPLVTQVVELTAADANRRGISVEVQRSPDMQAQANGDAEQLKRVLLNLTQNALQASPENGTVTLTLETTRHEIRIAISDKGSGMPDEVREKIFTPFFTTREKGTGLGLALSQKIVTEHSGRIEVETLDGVGTTMIVVIPRAD